jgi:hypothetical protein
LLNHPPPPTSISHPNSPQHTALPLQTATRPQLPTIPWPSSHACLSNPYDAGLGRKLILQSPLRKSFYYRIIHSLILHDFLKSWVLFNILPSPVQIYALLLTESVSLSMLLQILIGPLSNVFYAILNVAGARRCGENSTF